jgi:hypothetical protein
MIMAKNVLLVLVAGFIAVSPLFSDEQDIEMQSLTGISSFGVAIEGVDAANKIEPGLDRILKTDVELKLRLAGIKVQSSPSAKSNPDAIVAVNISFEKNPSHSGPVFNYIRYLNVSVVQVANLIRNGQPVMAITWTRSYYQIGPMEGAKNELRGHLDNLIDELLNEYLTVNPKE